MKFIERSKEAFAQLSDSLHIEDSFSFPSERIREDCLFLWPFTGLLGLIFDRRFSIAMACYLAGMFLCLYSPSRSSEIMIAVTVLGLGGALFRLGA